MCNDCLSLPQSQKVKARVRLNFFFFLVLINNFHFQMVYYYKEGIEITLDLNIQFFFTSSNIKLSYEDTIPIILQLQGCPSKRWLLQHEELLQ